MSLFVAIHPDERAVEDLQDAVHVARRLVPGVSWQPPGLWHLTLAFLGDPDEEVADVVADRLDELGDQHVIDNVRLSGSGCFGGQIVWIGLAPGPALDRLAALAHDIPRLLRGSGAQTDWRQWKPHLTVGRARRGGGQAAAGALSGYSGPAWSTASLSLVRSTGGPQPTHRVVHAVALAPQP
jgi:2'-5' RNA ligase